MASCNEIGERIRALREEKGLTQAQLAKELFIAKRETITQWEAGTRDLKTEYTIKLADYFGVTCDYILRGVKSENVEINKRLGLSDEAIEVLQFYNEYFQGDVLIRVVNFLLEHEIPNPSVYSNGFCYDVTNTKEENEILENQYFGNLLTKENEWKEKGYLALLSSLENYFEIEGNNEIVNILSSGKLSIKENDIDKKNWRDYFTVKKISQNVLIETSYIIEIEDKLKNLKLKYNNKYSRKEEAIDNAKHSGKEE